MGLIGENNNVVVQCINKIYPNASLEGTSIVSLTTYFSTDVFESSINLDNYYSESERIANRMIELFSKKLEVNIVDLSITFFSIVYVPFLFSFIKLLFLQQHGRILVILAFLCATATDTFAYEVGSRFGKHKLSPVVSPKKSYEGSIAGIIAAMIVSGVTCYVTNTYFDTQFNIILMTIMGAVFSIVGQIGDLAASSVKRYCGQKDFSNLLPGHGGILDRFDSIMFISPILYIFMYLINLL